MQFRDDINGLRAIAVAIVVLYHFRLGAAPGGFVGVDVFFAISGFLMTQIILGRLARGRFTLLDFYLARVRRIVPAMTVLVAATLAVGVAVMNPLRLESLARSALASLLFYSNIRYSHDVGYFSAPAEDNWLIHTWSLSVEWQFYMLYPLALLALARLGAHTRTIALAAVAGIAASLWLTVAHWQTGGGALQAGFFLLPGRAWEFLLGGLVAMAGPRIALPGTARIALHAAGLGLIAASVALVDRTLAWPSPMTIVPVAGTALVLIAGCERPAWARLAPVAALGRWSYSIYLWHWPIVALLAFTGHGSKPVAIAGIAASVLCGALSHALVETRLTAWLWQGRRLGRSIAVASFAGIAALALFASATNGLESLKYASHPDLLAALADDRAAQADWTYPKSCDRFHWDAATNFSRCDFGDPARHDTLVIGDSFAEQLTPRFGHALTDRGLTFITQGGCPPIPGVERQTPGMDCRRFVDLAYDFAAASPFKRVVFTALWPGYGPDNLCVGPDGACTAFDKTAFDTHLRAAFLTMAARWRTLRAAGKEVVVIDVPPYGAGDPAHLYAQAIAGMPVTTMSRPLADFRVETHDASALLAEAAKAAGVPLVDPAPELCPSGLCPIVVAGRTLYKDEVHLRASLMKDRRFAIYDRTLLPEAPDDTMAQGATTPKP